MPSFLTADDFLSGIVGEPTPFELDGVGAVLLRPLSMAEVQRIRRITKDDESQMTVQTVVSGLVEPKLSPEQVERLSDGAAGHIAKLAQRVMELSGMIEDDTAKNSPGGGS